MLKARIAFAHSRRKAERSLPARLGDTPILLLLYDWLAAGLAEHCCGAGFDDGNTRRKTMGIVLHGY